MFGHHSDGLHWPCNPPFHKMIQYPKETKFTTIQITHDTRDFLKKRKIASKESYNEIIQRLLINSKND